ncbi:Carbon monoxide dehydrogenase subunit G [Parafrankia irregularis]|uniref:Carbon monoxide dehydrogenase subunit G n=1 Tax=Parafrankia irregularis TaxID=795642 RepID=A0A0S4QI29_9ACTN|nr:MULTISPECIES: SRPBCC family protein [Parafrankia]MBE3203952.1 SRPBCC family protein [Parafrankia sp. CH37]CUU55175.1 Carbon monoxide dehydrogenase subunit G [Parafrankia irregularis]
MKLENTLSIPVPADEAWRVLLDVERITPCVPGAVLTSKDGDSYQGKIKVKVGPVGLTYNGTIKFVTQDEAAKVAVLEASGRELRGNGTAKALVTCRLVDSGDSSTNVEVETDLDITGKPAQFGRGVLAEVAGTLVGKFATNLANELTATPTETPATPAETPAVPAAPAAANGSAEPAAAPPAVPLAATEAPAAGAPAAPAAPAASAAPEAPMAEPLDLLATASAGLLTKFTPLLIRLAPLARYLPLARSAAAPAGALLLVVAVARRKPRPIVVNVVLPPGPGTRR